MLLIPALGRSDESTQKGDTGASDDKAYKQDKQYEPVHGEIALHNE
jgi:hypothetical protein